MKFSIVTVCFNSEKTIKDTIVSVNKQTHQNIEHIIVDGGSTDNTLKIVKELGKHIEVIISEPDTGIYDAMNKGLRASSGDFVGFLNSDDYLADKTVIEKYMKIAQTGGYNILFSDISYIDKFEKSKVIRKWKSSEFSYIKFFGGWIPPHPSFYASKVLYNQIGDFDIRFLIAADYDLMTRLLRHQESRPKYVRLNFAYMRSGGASDAHLISKIYQNFEVIKAMQKNGLFVASIISVLPRAIFKALQYRNK